MRIHREGRKMLAKVLAFAIAVIFGSYRFLAHYDYLPYIMSGAAVLVFLFFLQFFRNPVRDTVLNPLHIIAPSDGEVVVIEETDEEEYFHEKLRQISIFMSPLNVHVNRNPVSGTVKYTNYHPGKFLMAFNPKSSELNERHTVVYELANGVQIMACQIAGFLARRIKWYVKPGDEVTQGEEFGFIKFGSRLDVFLPLDAKVNVKMGDNVRGGQTVLASLAE